MKKARNRVDANHVRESTQISPDNFASIALPSVLDQTDKTGQQHQQLAKTSGAGKGFSRQLPPTERTRTDDGSSSAGTPTFETSGIVRRILANVNNSPVRDEGFGKQPVCLATRSPKAKPKTSIVAKVTDETGPSSLRIHETEKTTSGFPGRKESYDLVRDYSRSGTPEVGGANIHGNINSIQRRGVKNQNVSSDGDTSCDASCMDGCGKEDVYRSKTKEDMQNAGKTGGESSETRDYTFGENGKQQGPAVRTIVKCDYNEIRDSLIERKRSPTGRADERDISFGTGPEICSPPLPPSLSRDSGISSPSVDEVKPIDQRADEPKDNEGPMRVSRRETGIISSIRDDTEDRGNGERENKVESREEIAKKSSTVTKAAPPMKSSFNSMQAGDQAVCSKLNLSSYPPSATLPTSESIPCQGETNPVVSPLAPIVGQTDKAMVTALGIDEADTHAPMDSRLVSSDLCDDEPVTSANSTSVDATTTRPPAHHFEPQGPAPATSDSSTDGLATEHGALGEQNVNTNKTGVGVAEQTTFLQISSSNSDNIETYENTDGAELTNTLPQSELRKETTELLETLKSSEDELSITTSKTETIVGTAITPATSTASITRTNSCDQEKEKIEHNQATQYTHHPSDELNRTESDNKGDHVQEDVSGLNVSTFVHQTESLNSDCSISLCNVDTVEKIKISENEELNQKLGTEDETTKQKHTQEVIKRDNGIITETCDIVTSIKSIEGKSSSGPTQSEVLDTLHRLKPKRTRLNFKDEEKYADITKPPPSNRRKEILYPLMNIKINIQEVISLQSDSPRQKLKGILKSKSNQCISGTGNCVPENGKEKLHSTRSVSFKKTHTKNTFSYYNAAFEGEIKEEPSRRPSLADVVTHIMRTNSVVDIEEEEDNSHPYGRDNSLTDLINGKRRENINMDAGKMIVWLALAIMIVSLAGVIIFMSESYNLTHEEEVIYFPPDDTTLSHS